MNWLAWKTVLVVGLHFLAEYVDRIPQPQPKPVKKEKEGQESRGEEQPKG